MSDEHEGWHLVNEVERARLEDPGFAEVKARALAKARQEKYNPAIHGPFDLKKPPRQQRKEAPKPTNIEGELDKLLERFRDRGPKYVPKLADKPSRPDTHRRIAP